MRCAIHPQRNAHSTDRLRSDAAAVRLTVRSCRMTSVRFYFLVPSLDLLHTQGSLGVPAHPEVLAENRPSCKIP